jgi:hypothetical protein
LAVVVVVVVFKMPLECFPLPFFFHAKDEHSLQQLGFASGHRSRSRSGGRLDAMGVAWGKAMGKAMGEYRAGEYTGSLCSYQQKVRISRGLFPVSQMTYCGVLIEYD